MRVALSIMLMQECCNFICQWENEPGGVPIRIKHSSAVRYGEIFHPDSCNKSYIATIQKTMKGTEVQTLSIHTIN